MAAIDLRKVDKALYSPKAGKVELIEVPPLRYIAIDGSGDPNTVARYVNAVSALYATAYTIKQLRKEGGATDHTVMPLEGLWWMADGAPYSPTDRTHWRWTMLIRQPNDLTAEQFAEAHARATQKKGLEALADVRVEALAEGLSAQTLHIGPYADEAPTIALLHQSIEEQGRAPRDKHHEIYLGDPRRSDPARLKTILRQPIE